MLRQCNWNRLQHLFIPANHNSGLHCCAFRFRVALLTELSRVRAQYTSTSSPERSRNTIKYDGKRWRQSLPDITDHGKSGGEDDSPVRSPALSVRPSEWPDDGAQQQGKVQYSGRRLQNRTPGASGRVRQLRLSEAKQRVYGASLARAAKASQYVGVTGRADPQDNKTFSKDGYRGDGANKIRKFVAYRESASERIRRRFRRWERNRLPATDHEAESMNRTGERRLSDTEDSYHQNNDERSDVFFTEHLKDAVDDLTYAPPKAPAAVRKLWALDHRRLPTVIRPSVDGANEAGEYVSEDCIPVSVSRKGGS